MLKANGIRGEAGSMCFLTKHQLERDKNREGWERIWAPRLFVPRLFSTSCKISEFDLLIYCTYLPESVYALVGNMVNKMKIVMTVKLDWTEITLNLEEQLDWIVLIC